MFATAKVLLLDLVEGGAKEEECAFSFESDRFSISGFDVYWNQQLRIDAVRQALAAAHLEGKLKGKTLRETLVDLTQFESNHNEYFFSSLIEQTSAEIDPKDEKIPLFDRGEVLDVLRSLIKDEPVTMTQAECRAFVASVTCANSSLRVGKRSSLLVLLHFSRQMAASVSGFTMGISMPRRESSSDKRRKQRFNADFNKTQSMGTRRMTR